MVYIFIKFIFISIQYFSSKNLIKPAMPNLKIKFQKIKNTRPRILFTFKILLTNFRFIVLFFDSLLKKKKANKYIIGIKKIMKTEMALHN